jgi:hypothetical protein
MYWRSYNIIVLGYLDDFLLQRKGYYKCLLTARRIEGNFHSARLIINDLKCIREPTQLLNQLGFDINYMAVLFQIPVDRWEGLQAKIEKSLSAKGGRIQARKLSSFTDTPISMKLA